MVIEKRSDPVRNRNSRYSSRDLLLLVVFVSTIVIGLYTLSEQVVGVLVSFFVFGLTGFWLLARESEERYIYTIVYCLNSLVVVGLFSLYLFRYGTPYYIGGSDDLVFESLAKAAQTLGVFDYREFSEYYVPQFFEPVAYVYLLHLLTKAGVVMGGFHTLVPRLLNAGLLSMTAILVFRYARTSLGLRLSTAKVVGLAVGLAPITMYNAAHTFRDMLVTFLLFLLVYLWHTFHDYLPMQKVVLLIVSPAVILALWEIRIFIAMLAVVLVLFSFWHSYRKTALLLPITLVCVTVIAFIVWYSASVGQLQMYASRANYLQEVYTDYRLGLSNGLAHYVFSAPLFPFGYLYRIGFLMASPLPVPTLAVDRLVLSLGTLVQLFLLPFLFVGLWRLTARRLHLHLVFGFTGLIIAVAGVTFTERHIQMFYPFGALVTGYGYEYFRARGFGLWLAFLPVYFVLILGVSAYFVLKQVA